MNGKLIAGIYVATILFLLSLGAVFVLLGEQGVNPEDKFKVIIAPSIRVSKECNRKPLIKNAIVIGKKVKYYPYVVLVKSKFPQAETFTSVKDITLIYLKNK